MGRHYHVILAVALASPAFATDIEMQPEQVASGKPSHVQLTAQGGAFNDSSNFFLQPAAPYLKAEIDLQTPVLQISKSNTALLATTGSKSLFIISFDKNKARLLAKYTGTDAIHAVSAEETASVAYVNEGAHRITALDIAKPLFPQRLGSFDTDIQIETLTVSGQFVLAAGSGNALRLIDFRQAHTAIEAARTSLPAPIVAVSYADRIVVSTADGQIHLFDAKLQNDKSAAGGAMALAAYKNQLFSAGGEIGLTLYDMKDNDSGLRWRNSLNSLGRVRDVVMFNGQALTLSDVGQIRLIKTQGETPPSVTALYNVKEGVGALTADMQHVYAASGSRIMQLDFFNKDQDYLNHDVNFGGARKVVYRDGLAYVADWFSGLHIYDVMVAERPRLLSSLHTKGSPKGLLVHDRYAFLADDDDGLIVINIEKPTAPRIVASLDTAGLAYSMELRDNILYLADHTQGLHVIDVRDPEQPKRIGSLDTDGKAWSVALAGSYALVADDSNGLLVIDISQPESPRLHASYKEPVPAEDVAVKGDYAYVAYFNGGVTVLDIRQKDNPVKIAKITTPGGSRAVHIRDNRLYVADWAAGVQQYDITDPANPKHTAGYDTPGYVWGLAAVDDTIYVMDWWAGFTVLRATANGRLERAGYYHGRGRLEDLAVHRRYAYLAYGGGGLQVFDVRTPANPIWLTGRDTGVPAVALSLNAAQNRLYVVLDGEGIAGYNIENPMQPEQVYFYPLPKALKKISSADQWLFVQGRDGEFLPIYTGPAEHTPFLTAANNFWVRGDRLLVHENEDNYAYYAVEARSLRMLWRDKLTDSAADAAFHEDRFLLAGEGGRFYNYVLTDAEPQLRENLHFGYRFTRLHSADTRLFATTHTGQLAEIDMQKGHASLTAVYSVGAPFESFAFDQETVYLSAGKRLISLTLLPAIQMEAKSGTLDFPKGLPPGRYYVSTVDTRTGRIDTVPDILTADYAKPQAKKFTLQDLEKAMRQRELIGSQDAVE